ncbi:hypothetical protein P43SY_000900 [Pythium insidiosum]|uniref:RxLR effector candidate protein n=1 Tax=Pythium insidiosum TaxID=114742 RepID=A0AAD5Q8Y2_PYTIN|nr:hypothetical protein P43SY_000900 [Pythium insidiosum]
MLVLLRSAVVAATAALVLSVDTTVDAYRFVDRAGNELEDASLCQILTSLGYIVDKQNDAVVPNPEWLDEDALVRQQEDAELERRWQELEAENIRLKQENAECKIREQQARQEAENAKQRPPATQPPAPPSPADKKPGSSIDFQPGKVGPSKSGGSASAPIPAPPHVRHERPMSSAPLSARSEELTAWFSTPDRDVPSQVRSYLGLPATPSARRVPNDAWRAVTEKTRDLAQWCFLVHGAEPAGSSLQSTSEQVMQELALIGNMARRDVWQHFFVRQFFLSGAPLSAFLALYDVHRSAVEAAGESPLACPVSLLVREYVLRGRVDEAIDAYTTLPLRDTERRSFTALLHQYEHYDALRRVYALQRARDEATSREQPLLDPLFILHALKELGLRDEMRATYSELPSKEQRRSEIQKLVAE